MGRIAQDTFIRSNQSGFGTASDGETYTIIGPGTLAIASNSGTIVSISNDTLAQLGTHTATDVDVLCRMAVNNTSDVCGIQGRYTTTGGGYAYKLLWYSNAIHLNKAVAGANSQLTSVAFTMNLGVFYWFRLRLVGSLLAGKIWQDGTAEPMSYLTTITDTSVTGAGTVTMLVNTATSTSVQMDHFSAISFVNTLRPPHLASLRILT